MTENKTYNYAAKLQLSHEYYADHFLTEEFNGAAILLESEGFRVYKDCAEALNALAKAVMAELTERTEREFMIAWETHPKDGKDTHISPIEAWGTGEIIKYYIIEKTDKTISYSTLNPMLAASIYVHTPDFEDCH